MKVEVDVLGSPSLIIVVSGRFYIALFSALEQTHCARMWFYMSDEFLQRVFEYPPKWCTYSADMAGAT